MEPARSRPQRADFPAMHLPQSRGELHVPRTRAELLGYFAWGYLSRRELNERLNVVEPRERARARERGHTSRAA
jgi:hypothetical protein